MYFQIVSFQCPTGSLSLSYQFQSTVDHKKLNSNSLKKVVFYTLWVLDENVWVPYKVTRGKWEVGVNRRNEKMCYKYCFCH